MVPFFYFLIMTYITATASQTELSAINRMLASVGVAPITSIDTESILNSAGNTEIVQTNPDVAIAINTLTEVSREVQSEGWVFNKEYNVKVYPNNNNELVISELETTLGNTILLIDLNTDVVANKNRDVIVKNGKLYNRTAHSYEWTDSTVYVDIMYQYNWLDLPVHVQDYIAKILKSNLETVFKKILKKILILNFFKIGRLGKPATSGPERRAFRAPKRPFLNPKQQCRDETPPKEKSTKN